MVRERREVREGVLLVTFGSSSVVRAHNLWNGGALGVVEAEEPLTTCVCGGVTTKGVVLLGILR